MKKNIAFALVAGLALGAFAERKVGTVDMMLLVRNHPNYESNKALLTSTEKDYQKKLDRMKEDLEKVQEDGRKLSEQLRNPMLAAQAKTKVEKDLTEVQSKFMSGQQRLRSEAMRSQQDLQDLEARLLKATSADLKKRIGKFAADNGYDFVIDASAAVYSKDAYDVTGEILKAMGVNPADVKKKADESK